jgi:hypothetical protein
LRANALSRNQSNLFKHLFKNSSVWLIAIILTSGLLVGLAINEKVISEIHSTQSISQTNPSKEGVIQYGRNGIRALDNLLANFSSMSVVFNSTTPGDSKDCIRASYMLLGITYVNKVQAYEVNITGAESTSGEKDNEFLLAWISTSNGQVIQTQDEYGTLQGAKAEQEDNVLSMFTTMPWLSLINSSTVMEISGSEHPMTIGQVTMYVTTYKGLPSFTAYADWTIEVGMVPTTGMQLVVFCSYLSAANGYKNTFQIISIS